MSKTKNFYVYLIVDLQTFQVRGSNGVCPPTEICEWLARKLKNRELEGIPLDPNEMIVICPVRRVPHWFKHRHLGHVLHEALDTKQSEERNGRCH